MNLYPKPYYFLFTLPIALWGYLNDLPYVIILAEVLFSFVCLYHDYTKGARYISFITVYSAFTLTYCYGNAMVVKSIGTPDEAKFNYYLVPEHISEALFFIYIAHVFCVLGFNYYQNKYKNPTGLFFVMDIPIEKPLVRYLNILVTIANVLVLLEKLPYATVFPFSIAFLFFLTRYAVKKDDQWLLNFCLVNTFILSINGFFFDYLRMSTIAPGIAFLIAVFFGKEKVSALFKKTLFPVYGLLFVAVTIFPFIGQIRNSASGYEKIFSVVDKFNESGEEFMTPDLYAEEDESFEARVSIINQTSQIVKLVKEDGYYKGSSLAYLTYAFIPRFLWKDKPIIAQGVWFALAIGQAYVHADGRANNSVNMTSAGELYLNFGLAGVAIGMFMIGYLCAYMWQVSGFSESSENVLGAMFGLYLFYLATSTFGIDLQFLVTLLSYFCMFQLVNYLYLYFLKPKKKVHA